ncbi:hypothetical protein CR513_06894, partial [Mucuna pruriens]
MGYIYEPMDRAKKLLMTMKISTRIFSQSLIEDGIANFTILCMQLQSNIEMDCEVLEDLYICIARLSKNDEFVDHIHNELPICLVFLQQ